MEHRFGELFQDGNVNKNIFNNLPFLRKRSNFRPMRENLQHKYGNEIEFQKQTKIVVPKVIESKKEVVKPSVKIRSYQAEVSLEWLRTMCLEKFNSKDVSLTIIEILKNRNQGEIQQGLFEVLGVENFDFMETLIKQRDTILLKAYEEEMLKLGIKPKKKEFLSGISIVNLEKEKLQKKINNLIKNITKRKDISKKEKKQEDEREMVLNILQNQIMKLEKEEDQNEKKTSSIIQLLEKFYPELDFSHEKDKIKIKTVQKDGYLEFHVEPPPLEEHTDKLKQITEFPEWARSPFRGFPSLNRIQTIAHDVAFLTNENMLICAPTGCGKTNIAMMTILQEVGKHLVDDILRVDEFKILYITPMKALASEIVRKFSSRLQNLGITVKEYTGDMKLSRKQIERTQIIVSTPEKWDVITRKQSDTSLIQSVRLIIIDEIHLLNDNRGPVIESIVARTLRQIEQTQKMVRLVGLSATLPNYEDVGNFLRVNLTKGLFYFDNSFRPVPLYQKFIGVEYEYFDEVCFEKVEEAIDKGYQIMVFVHSRKGTVLTCKSMIEIAQREQKMSLFEVKKKIPYSLKKRIRNSPNKELQEFVPFGLSFHHAGMLRRDKNLVEALFRNGHLKMLCCTATLAWGVNLPAHTVIIKGTELYSAEESKMVQLGILDVMQIFGRAGRPQYDKTGEGIIITKPPQAPKYLALLNNAIPIESKLSSHIENHLNAEIVLGSVTNIREAIRWLTYTYFFLRIQKNPTIYGIPFEQYQADKNLGIFRRELTIETAKVLDNVKMIRYDPYSETLSPTFLGRIASHYYIHYETIELFNQKLKPTMEEDQILVLICECKEFHQIKVRREEQELEELSQICPVEIKGGSARSSKVNVLLQTYISNIAIRNFALISDCAYIIDNVGRIVRAMLEICLFKRWSYVIDKLIILNKCLKRRMWAFRHPLRQLGRLSRDICEKLEGKNRMNKNYSVEELLEMDPRDIDDTVRVPGIGFMVHALIEQLPYLEIETRVQPLTRNIIKIEAEIKVAFKWTTKNYHREVEPFWFFIEDPYSGKMFYQQYFTISRKNRKKPLQIKCMIPLHENQPSQKIIRIISDRWLGVEIEESIDFDSIVLPEKFPPNTKLLSLKPLEVKKVLPPKYAKLFKFPYFNPVQTQVFHTVYHTDNNVLLGSATGSGKTVIAELGIIRCFEKNPGTKVIYIAPLKALVREKLGEWRSKFPNKRVVELTGDFTPDVRILRESHIVVTTPEKWDGISRSWQKRKYVQTVGLVVIDECHLLGTERGSVLEVMISRMRYISYNLKKNIRIIAIGTSLANSDDVVSWLGIEKKGNYNFKNSVRPVPLDIHVQGFSEKYYCPRMDSMNKPVFQAIQKFSNFKPVLIFVSSRRQTRLTALSIITFCINQGTGSQFCSMNEVEIKKVQSEVKDVSLKHSLAYGIGIHHAGLVTSDKEVVEYLFLNSKIQVIVSTATLAWGVNLPAHEVIIKGTEYFDPKTKTYVQYPPTDILQMMGRAGRPQFDNEGVVCIMVISTYKDFYKKFLFEPFPVESYLHKDLHNHINAEIVSKVIQSRQDGIDYLTWTFLFRRLLKNPTYYEIEDSSYECVTGWLSKTIDGVIEDLEENKCISFDSESQTLKPEKLGEICSFYYIDYTTAHNFYKKITRETKMIELLEYISLAKEYDELPVRHNEDKLNEKLSEVLPWDPYTIDFESPNLKTYLLLQSHFGRIKLPITDYVTDLKTVLDQTVRILQAFIDVSSYKKLLKVTLNLIHIQQMVMQGRWFNDNSLLILPHMNYKVLKHLRKQNFHSISQIIELTYNKFFSILQRVNSKKEISKMFEFCKRLPLISFVFRKTVKKDSITFKFSLRRLSPFTKYAYTPKYQKKKSEGWWIIIADKETEEMLSIQRLMIKGTSRDITVTLSDLKKMPANVKVLFMSDSYIGLDLEFLVKIE